MRLHHGLAVGLCGALIWAAGAQTASAKAANRLGVGANYWVTVDSIKVDDVDDNGFSYFLSYQRRSALLGFQVDLEMLPDRFGEDAYAPQAYLVLGNVLYAAAGVGIVHQDSDWADDPFYSFKVGLDIELIPSLFLDIAANYRFEKKTQLKDRDTNIDTDTVFLGAALRLGF